MEFWPAAIEQLDTVRALRTSFYVYPLISALHVLGIGMLLTGVLLMDLRLLGAFRALPDQPFIHLLRRVTLLGFVLAAASGVLLFSVQAVDYVAMPLFWIKLGLIVAAGLNLLVFIALDRRTIDRGSARLKASGAVSLLLWLGVLLAGRLLGFVS